MIDDENPESTTKHQASNRRKKEKYEIINNNFQYNSNQLQMESILEYVFLVPQVTTVTTCSIKALIKKFFMKLYNKDILQI